MRCPVCKRETRWKGNPYRPFCSARCKLLDLYNWLSERYRVPGAADTAEQSGAVPDASPGNKGERG